MNRRELIKYGIGTIVGVTATKVLSSPTPEVLQPEILSYEEDKTPLIYSPGKYIWFQGMIYNTSRIKNNTPRIEKTIAICRNADAFNELPEYIVDRANFIGIVKEVNFNGKDRFAVDWEKNRYGRVVLEWNKKTHAKILHTLGIKHLSQSSYHWYNWYNRQSDYESHKDVYIGICE